MTTDEKLCPRNPLCDLAKVKFEEMDKRWSVKLEAIQVAIDKSEDSVKIRLEAMNQFREQIREREQNLTTRREAILLNFIISLIVAAIAVFVAHLVGNP